ncbi:MAG TPA: thioesterase family protein [Cyclobacteriaceae bacterium]|nr:acyl-CoA thioesterase [Cyclobacteriaceae bacterium]HMV09502.1 thioesterase family protein [Cyclobacteriaceae bacterium]HMV91806.1 thioesterase family protein [Cyclobacteriaceae bacterium]HMX02665.1 thioesterase family protein [Cyclobacteriaceae bacterium]HMX51612.1 thioesterase family protein [Cyclobacteriaceae bacterium]
MKNTFIHSITVTPDDIDEMNHVNNVVYLRWVQDAAAAHWDAIASDEMKRKYAWVVLRHEIDYKSPALLGDPVQAETWVSSREGVRSVRHVRLTHGASGVLFAEAVTTWCLLDAVTKRPRRIESDITSIF